MTFEEFRNLAQGIQAIFIIIGAIIASVWALYTFRSTQTVKKSSVELNKLNADIDKSRTELAKLKNEQDSTPMVSVELAPCLLGSIEENDLHIRLKIHLKNIGNTSESVDWTKSKIMAAIVESVVDAKLNLSSAIHGAIGQIEINTKGLFLWPGETSLDEFLIPISEHNIYVITTIIYVYGESKEVLADAMSDIFGNYIYYGASTYFDSREK